jgi:hypothetical protein
VRFYIFSARFGCVLIFLNKMAVQTVDPKSFIFVKITRKDALTIFLKCSPYDTVGTVKGRVRELTVVLDYYEAMETYSRIGLLRSYGNLQSYWIR